MKIFEVLFEPRDIWIGIFWDMKDDDKGIERVHVYVCLLPMFPIHVVF